MTQQLKEMVETYLIKNGSAGKLDLAKAVDKTPRTIDRWMSGETAPSDHDQYTLALACGCAESEALQLAKGEGASPAKETA